MASVTVGCVPSAGSWAPALVQARETGASADAWARNNRPLIEELRSRHRAVLFRGFDIDSHEDFQRFAVAITGSLEAYTERAAPRVEVGNRIYSSTEYPPQYPIPLHHENAFAYRWPKEILLFCKVAPAVDGATPIAEDQEFFKHLDPAIRRRFETAGVMYVRNYGGGVELPWQEVFGSRTREEVESYCRSAGIEWEWRSHDRLRTRRVAPAIIHHPVTGLPLWFNHAHLFHISNVEPDLRSLLLEEVGPENLPRNAFYGDGTPIEDEVMDHVREAYDRAAVRFAWQKGDVLYLENMSVAHGRDTFSGPRTILVAMAGSMGSTI